MSAKRRRGAWVVQWALVMIVLAAGCAPSSGTGGPASRAATDENALADFFRGKTVQIVVATGSGGGFDIYSRLIATHMAKYIPGNPTIVIDNKPGAGHMLGMNYIYNVAPRNGLAIGNATGGLAIAQVFGASGVEFDMTKLEYLGIPTTDTMVMIVARESGVRRLEDARAPRP